VSSLAAEIATAAALFAGTNVDDVVVLSLLTASSRAGGRPRRWGIWVGQYAGFAVLVGLSAAAGRGLALVPARWLWLLALIPLGLGVANLAAAIRSLHRGARPRPPSAGGPLGVAALTVVDGVDNLAAYTPFFATAGAQRIWVTCAMFVVCVAAWCVAGRLLTRHPRVTEAIERHDWWILPVAFIFIGIYVLLTTLNIV
jgi:cadmium resistance protein CadD (predicted permease)